MSNDSETKKMVGEAEALEAMFQSSGWKIAQRELHSFIADLKDITTLNVSEQDISQQVRDRINTAAALEHWIDELQGMIDNAKFMTQKPKDNELVTRR